MVFNERKYLITAKHCVPGIHDGDNIRIYYQNDWLSVQIEKVFECSNLPELDIVALLPKSFPRQGHHPLKSGTRGCFVLGQDVFLLGFPGKFLEDRMSMLQTMPNEGFPVPIVRKCAISYFGDSNQVQHIYLDTTANKGFSGGPVYIRHGDESKVIGVISSHLYDHMPLLRADDRELEEKAKIYSHFSCAHNLEPIASLLAEVK